MEDTWEHTPSRVFDSLSGLRLISTSSGDPRLLAAMAVHYSHPKGIVGRRVCYAVRFDGWYYGHIVGASATPYLPGRHEYLGTTQDDLQRIVNNTFYHIEKREGRYPARNFASAVIAAFRGLVVQDWSYRYGDEVAGFETLVEPPRTGECYLRDGWSVVGTTRGISIKRPKGVRVRDAEHLRPKLVLCRRVA